MAPIPLNFRCRRTSAFRRLQTVGLSGKSGHLKLKANAMTVVPEPFNLSDLKVSYRIVREPVRVLVVAFHGEYRPGSKGNDDAHFMHGVASAGVEARRPNAVVFDFRDLKYVWGDMLELVYNAAPAHKTGQQTFAVVAGESSVEAIRTLELGQFSEEPITAIPWLHTSFDAAYDYLSKTLSGTSA